MFVIKETELCTWLAKYAERLTRSTFAHAFHLESVEAEENFHKRLFKCVRECLRWKGGAISFARLGGKKISKRKYNANPTLYNTTVSL